jgi:hypothetical protein
MIRSFYNVIRSFYNVIRSCYMMIRSFYWKHLVFKKRKVWLREARRAEFVEHRKGAIRNRQKNLLYYDQKLL